MVYFDVLSSKMQEERSNKVLHSSTGPLAFVCPHTWYKKFGGKWNPKRKKCTDNISIILAPWSPGPSSSESPFHALSGKYTHTPPPYGTILFRTEPISAKNLLVPQKPSIAPPPPTKIENRDALMPDCGVHYLWFAFVCFLIRSPPPPPRKQTRICVYTYTCPCARVNAVSGLFFREGGPRPPSQISSLHVYNMPTVSTISRPRLLVVHSVYRLYPGKREYAQCLQTMQSVYKLCTVSADYAQVNVYVHSVYKPRTVSTNYAQCPQTIHIHIHVYAHTSRNVYAYTCIRVCARIHTYLQPAYLPSLDGAPPPPPWLSTALIEHCLGSCCYFGASMHGPFPGVHQAP